MLGKKIKHKLKKTIKKKKTIGGKMCCFLTKCLIDIAMHNSCEQVQYHFYKQYIQIIKKEGDEYT